MKVSQLKELTAAVTKNVALGTNIASLSLIRRPREMLLYLQECLFLYKTLTSGRGVPQKHIFEALPAPPIQSVTLATSVDERSEGSTFFCSAASYATDIISLCLIARIIEAKRVFEIGTMRGYTAYHFALNTADDAKIFTLDLPREHGQQPVLRTTYMDDIHVNHYRSEDKYWFTGEQCESKIRCLFGDSALFDFSPYHRQIDLFFIDGSHSYEYVRSDTLNGLQCCRPGSVMVWHDFGRVGVNGVTRWVQELSKEHPIYAVPGGSLAYMQVR